MHKERKKLSLLLVLWCGMMLFQLLHGLFTEHLARGILSGLTWSGAAVELAAYAALSSAEIRWRRGSFCVSPDLCKEYALTALLISLGRGLTWVAYGSLSYPTVIVFKSSKMLVVMASGSLILRKHFTIAQYFAAILLMAGLFLVSTADVASSIQDKEDTGMAFSVSWITGICVAGSATVFEGVVSNLQERSLSCEHRSLAEMIFFTNGMGSMLLLLLAAFNGEMDTLAASVWRDPSTLSWLLATVMLAYG